MFSDHGVVIVDCKEVIRIYAEKQKVYAQTKNGIYTVRMRLYEMEEKKQVSGVSALFVNFSAFLSGIWFELDLIGSTFKMIAYLLPFVHAVDATRAVLVGEYGDVIIPLLWTIGYTVLIFLIAIISFQKLMKGRGR